MTVDTKRGQLDEIRDIVATVLELEPDELTDESLFVEDHDADSLRAVEILARLEKSFKVDIPQSELPKMVNVVSVYDVVAAHAGWQA
ncbi:acyl carrier protein [Amycolatopsis aidingensis]|uniref:acyl carrier protein n=1 Tax=Amycolatopsis aidingensis TaxID=2842453 RepID=UPI001C0BA34F|nr:acyl carrier protein [Amycolatopsis aidingensis]